MVSNGVDLSVIHDNDFVGVFHGRDALCDDDFCCLRDFSQEGPLNQCIGLSVHCTGGVIHNKYFWFFKQSPGDTETLLLAAGNIASALLNICVIAIRKGPDKVIGLGQLTGVDQFLIGGLGISPSKIFLDRA